MKVALVNQMQEIDRITQRDYRIPGDLLMERAALAVLEILVRDRGSLVGKRIDVFCGKGNNAGDGLALARMLGERQVAVNVVLAVEPDQLTGLAAENLQRAQRYGVPVVYWREWNYSPSAQADLLIDALLGTGAKGEPHGTIAEMILAMNQNPASIYALDLPSGIDADTGAVPGVAIKALKTITFGLPQPGLLIYPGAEMAGEVVVAGIGFPKALLEAETLKLNCLTDEEAATYLPRRSPVAHKGTTGHLLAVGGSPGMTGAIALTALSALRIGCGMVTAGLREPMNWLEKPLEVMAVSWEDLEKRLGDFRCVVIGPGMGRADDGRQLLQQLLHIQATPLVVDADGLTILAQNREWLKNAAGPVILTPHPGEMARLTGLTIAELQADRLNIARQFAEAWGAIVVLKGARTIIALPDGVCYINLSGHSAMATAGMGDALAGIIGGLLCQGLSPEDAAVLGVYLHGKAGERAAMALGPAGIITRDVIEQLPQVINVLLTDLRNKKV